MSDVDTDRDLGSESASTHLGDDEVRALLRNAMRVDISKPTNVLPGVQKKIRIRSRGKFYADGWSVGRSPRSTYFVTSVIMLVVAVLMYFALIPGGWGAL